MLKSPRLGGDLMIYKTVAIALLAGFILAGTAEAYDLPKITVNKKLTVEETKLPMFKSDWTEMTRFEAKLKAILADNKKLPAASPERVSYDKNRVFIAFYKGSAYFLDKYSVEVKSDVRGKRSWTQRIFPIGQNVTPKNAVATEQSFCFDGRNFFNATSAMNPIAKVENSEDKAFLQECFRVGYYFAFGEELDD